MNIYWWFFFWCHDNIAKKIYQSETAAVFVTGLFPRYQFQISPGAFHPNHVSLNSAKHTYMPVSCWLTLQCTSNHPCMLCWIRALGLCCFCWIFFFKVLNNWLHTSSAVGYLGVTEFWVCLELYTWMVFMGFCVIRIECMWLLVQNEQTLC